MLKAFSRVVAASAVVALIAGVGCNRGSGTKVLRLAFVTNNTSDFWKIAQAGVRRYESEAKIQVDVKMPTDGKTPAEQNQILQDLMTQGYDGIAVSVIAPADQIAVLNRVADKAKLITFDSDAPQANRLLYIGTKNFEAGRELGRQIVKLLPDGGKLAVFVGTLSADNARQRLEGIIDATKDHKIEVAEKQEDSTDRERARSNVEAVLNARQDINCVVGLWSYNGPAISAAIGGSGKKGKVHAAVFDEEEGTLKGIEDGTIDVTVVQKPFDMGYQSAKWLHTLATKGNDALGDLAKDKQLDTGVQVLTKGDVAAFRTKLEELKK